MDDDHEHDDDVSGQREWDGTGVPSVDIDIAGDPTTGYTVTAAVENFTFTGADVLDPVPGEGHAHLFVNGTLVTMAYGPTFGLPELDPGTHHVMVSLSTNDRLEYVLNGEVIASEVMLEVPDTGQTASPPPSTEAEDDTVRITIAVTDGEATGDTGRVEVPMGSEVVLTVTADVADEIHVHGYDQFAEAAAGMPTEVIFTADIPGIFEVELEDSRLLLVELEVRP